MNELERKTLLDNGHHARVLLEQQTLWDLSELLTAMNTLLAIPFGPELLRDAGELVDTIARFIEEADQTMGEMAEQMRGMAGQLSEAQVS